MILTGHERRADVTTSTRIDLPWEELVRTTHRRRAEKDGPGVSFASYLESCSCRGDSCGGDHGHRLDENVIEVTALGLDLDKRWIDGKAADIDPATAEAAIARLAALGLKCWIYSTHSATAERPSLRAIIALSRPVPRADWRRFWRAAVASLGIYVQTVCQNEARFWYLPSAPEGAAVVNLALEGAPLDVDRILTAAPERAAEPEKRLEPVEIRSESDPWLLNQARVALRKHGPAVEGEEGDPKTYQAACKLRDLAIPEDAAFELLLEWNATCEPPWADGDLAEKLRNAYRYAKGAEGAKLLDLAVVQAVEELARPFAVPAGAEASPWESALLAAQTALEGYRGTGAAAAGKLARPAFQPAQELLGKDFPPTPWLIQGLVTERSVGVTSAEPKSIKTWIELENALAVATGTPSMGEYQTGPARPVALFLAEDDARSARNRLSSLAAARGMEPALALRNVHVSCRQHLNLGNDADLIWILASCAQIPGLALVVLDPLRDVHAAEENDSTGMADVMGRLRAIRDIVGCSVRTPHHAKKETSGRSERGGQNMRGSSAIHGALDCGLYLDNLVTNGSNRWSVRVGVEIKAAKGAGSFKVTLEVTDNAAGEAMGAAWKVDKGAPDAAKVDELQRETEAKTLEVLRALWDADLTKGQALGADKVRGIVKGALGVWPTGNKPGTGVRGALAEAKARGLATSTDDGWRITDAGKARLKGPPPAPAAV